MITKFLKGMCYEPFPHDYNPSTANDTLIFFGSDIASYNMKPLWGDSFSPIDGPTKGKVYQGRNDIKNLADMGVKLIRLYDWDADYNHIPFLNYCEDNDIKVLVPISNWNLGAFGKPPNMVDSITGLIDSYTKDGDYHPAIFGITIGCETDQLANVPEGYLIEYTKKLVEIEASNYSFYRKVKIGHPISFAVEGPRWRGSYPCFGYLDKLIPSLIRVETRDLNKRLIICPHTYNEASYLYNNAQGTGKGWVDLCYDRYSLPVLFCEIGCSRMTRADYLDVISGQLSASIAYNVKHPAKLIGINYFQYCDKVWVPKTTEGSFGCVSNTEEVTNIVYYGPKDFNTNDECDAKLNIQILKDNPSKEIIKGTYGNNRKSY